MLPRLRSQPGVLVAVLASIGLAATLLAVGPVLATAVAEGGLRADLAGADPAAIGIEVEVRTSGDRAAEVAASLEDLVTARFGDLVAPVDTWVSAGTVRFAGQPEDVVTPVVVTDIGGGDDLLEPGRSGGATGEALPVRLHEDALAPLGVRLGDVLQPVDGAPVQVAGTVVPTDATDRRWWDEPLGRDAVVPGVDFTQVGPVFLDSAADVEALLGADPVVAVRVRTLPVLEAVTPATLDELTALAEGLDERVDLVLARDDLAERWQVRTPLADAADAATVSLAATRAAVIATVAQVGVLAVYTLGLAGRLLRSGREVETMLLRARGATPEQLGRVALLEGLVLVVPAVLAAPWLAVRAVRGLDALGVTGDSTLALRPTASPAALGAAAVAGLACLVVLVVPAVTGARRTYASAREARGRRSPVGVVQQLGLDLALVVVAGIGIWQLRSTGGPVGTVGPGEVDPVLVVAPALGLLAGALLVLRLVPTLARSGEVLADRLRGLVAGLGGWQVARRPDSVARPTLLLVLGVAVGVLATTYGTTWRVSQAHQAEVAVGADLVVDPDRRVTALPDWRAASVLARDPAVDRVRPVWEGPVSLVDGAPGGTLVAVDAAAPVLAGRPDTRPSVPVTELDVAPLGGLPLPAGDDLEVTTTLVEDPAWPGQTVDLAFVVRDGHGLTHLLPRRTAGAGTAVNAWSLAGITPPAAVVALLVDTSAGALDGSGYAGPPLPSGASLPPPVLDLAVSAPRVEGRPAAVDDGWVTDPWTSLAPSPPELRSTTVTVDGWRVRGTTGVAGPRGRSATLRIVHPDAAAGGDAAVPAVVHPDVLTATGRRIGEELVVTTAGSPLRLVIVGTMPLVPGAVEARQPLLVDLDAIAVARWAGGRDLTRPRAWHVDLVADPAEGELAASRRLVAAWSAPPVDAPAVRAAALDEADRLGDPIAVGLVAALALGALAAAALAVLGTVTTAVVGVRERAGEFALLQAVGTSLRQLRWWLATEIAVVVTVGLAAGALLGAVLVWAVLPTIALAADGSPAVPSPVVVVPVRQLLVAAGGVVAAFTLVPVVLTRVVARAHVAEVLRLGEDT